MAGTKKTTAAKSSAKAVTTKAAETKKAETSAAPEVKEAPKAEAKTTAKKAAAKTAAKPAAKRTTAKKAAVVSEVHVEFSGRSYAKEDLVKIAQDIWQYDLEKKPEDFKSVSLYIKMEENKVYYVINDEVEGSFDI